MANKIQKFVSEVAVEFKKVAWPSRNELISSTIAVIVLVTLLSIFIGVCDLVLSKGVNMVIRWSL
ncbi:MAG: preprotein translocase subunit SecE [Candidatus Omnitrophota bacterium]